MAVFLLCTFASVSAAGQAAPPASPRGTGQAAVAKEAVSDADKTRAAALFNKSVDAYRQGDFKRAIELLDQAYVLDPQPVLVYNRARAAEGLGNIDTAISGYEKFLSEEPKAPDRGAIEQRVATLKRQRDERAALEHERDARREQPPPLTTTTPAQPSPAPPPPPAESAEQRPSRSPLPYVVAGVGAAGLVTGALFGILALSKKDDAVAEPVQRESIDLKGTADGLATVSTASFIVGGVLVAAGAVWWLVDRRAFKNDRAGRLGPHFRLSGIGGNF
jgi:tetratricopeptide (TPR) repeat protein